MTGIGFTLDPALRDPQHYIKNVDILHRATLTKPPTHLYFKAFGELRLIVVDASIKAHASKVVSMDDAMKTTPRIMKTTR